jgi:putative Mg2+ transporter-C (MgtC) family protein
MRLPLGILTGVGFIGAGAILRRGERVVGVTTAATLWYVTVIGLCFGGGQLALGWIGTAVGCLVLWGLRWVERLLPQESYARLTVTVATDGVGECVIRDRLSAHGVEIINTSIRLTHQSRCYVLSLRERRLPDGFVPSFVAELEHEPGIATVHWQAAPS